MSPLRPPAPNPLVTLREKLAYLEDQRAINSNAAEKFELKKRIEECERDIAELEAGGGPIPESTAQEGPAVGPAWNVHDARMSVKNRRRAEASAGISMVIAVIDVIWQVYGERSRGVFVLLLFLVFVGLAYSFYQYGWASAASTGSGRVGRVCIALVTCVAIPVALGKIFWPRESQGFPTSSEIADTVTERLSRQKVEPKSGKPQPYRISIPSSFPGGEHGVMGLYAAVTAKRVATPVAYAFFVRISNNQDFAGQISRFTLILSGNGKMTNAVEIPGDMQVYFCPENNLASCHEIAFPQKTLSQVLEREPIKARGYTEGWLMFDAPPQAGRSNNRTV